MTKNFYQKSSRVRLIDGSAYRPLSAYQPIVVDIPLQQLTLTLMPNSHRRPYTTRQCCLCRVRRCELSLETVWQSLNSQPIDPLVAWRLVEKFRFSQLCSSPQRVYILGGVQRRCVWAVGRLGVAACLASVAAAAVDRQARQSCRVSK